VSCVAIMFLFVIGALHISVDNDTDYDDDDDNVSLKGQGTDLQTIVKFV